MQIQKTCLMSYFIDTYHKRCFYSFGNGFWQANLFSLTLFCVYPEIENQKALFGSKSMFQKALIDCSSVFVKRIRRIS